MYELGDENNDDLYNSVAVRIRKMSLGVLAETPKGCECLHEKYSSES